MERTHRRRRWWAALALAVVGCSDTCGSSTQPGAVGELGNGRFLYTCGGPSDPACEGSSNDEPLDSFPDCIALGGTFDLEYELIDDSALELGELTPVLYVESVNQSFFRGTDDFEALRPGSAAFLVREGERVLDLIHLAIVEPDAIDVVTRHSGTRVSLLEIPAPGAEELLVLPRSSECLELGGAVPIEAESSDPTIVAVTAHDVLRIEAVSPGTAVVRARIGELQQAITVIVTNDTSSNVDTGPSETSGEEGSITGSSGSPSETSDTTDAGTTDPGTSGGSTEGASGSSTTGGT